MGLYPLLPPFQQAILTTASGLLVYSLLCVIYNLFFHPLARFPGPRGAACTNWWLAYMELGRGISLATLRTELHGKYGIPLYPVLSCLHPINTDQVILSESPQMR